MDLTESFPITHERTADADVLAPTGELDIATVPLLEAAYEELEHASVVLDLAGVTFIDSSGLQLLLRLSDRSEGRLEIISSPALDRLLQITGVRDQLPLRD
jgi:anti-sigma B factor antagonist